MYKKWFLALLVFLSMFGLALFAYGTVKNQDPAVLRLKIRAAQIFEQESQQHSLPPHQLVALSVALEFHDYRGAEIIIKRLETLKN